MSPGASLEEPDIAKEREMSSKSDRKKGISLKKFFAVALVLFVLLLGYLMAPGAIDAPENSKLTPTPTPELTQTVTLTPKITQTISPTSVAVSSAEQKTITNSIGMKFVFIPAGEFDMGAPAGEKDRDDDEGPVHHVKISNAFYMGKYEVTQKQWRDVMGKNPSNFIGDNRPVVYISWNDAQGFIKKLNEKEGLNKYRLPSDAEWEYAARAETTTRYSFGDDESKFGEYEWYAINFGDPHEVGQKKPNPWGLYDMHSNVWEWVQDSWHSNYDGAPADGSAWEGDGSSRVLRGGCWGSSPGDCRSAVRMGYEADVLSFGCGFRLLRDL